MPLDRMRSTGFYKVVAEYRGADESSAAHDMVSEGPAAAANGVPRKSVSVEGEDYKIDRMAIVRHRRHHLLHQYLQPIRSLVAAGLVARNAAAPKA